MGAAERAAMAFVLNAVWQLPLSLGVGWCLARMFRAASARALHLLWTLVLVTALALPLAGTLGFGRAMRASGSPPRGSTASGSTVTAPPGDAGLADLWERGAEIGTSEGGELLGRAALLLVLVPAAFGCLRLAHGARRARRLRVSALALGEHERAALLADPIRRALGLGAVPLHVTSVRSAPAALGAVRPSVLLPRRLLDAGRDSELRAVIAHELAHVARRDAARHMGAEIALLPLRFHPLVRVLRRRLVESREMACDETAAAILGDTRSYARALLDVSAILAGFSRPLTLPGVLDPGLLEARMRRLSLNAPLWTSPRARVALIAAALVLTATSLVAAPFAIGVSRTGGHGSGRGQSRGSGSILDPVAGRRSSAVGRSGGTGSEDDASTVRGVGAGVSRGSGSTAGSSTAHVSGAGGSGVAGVASPGSGASRESSGPAHLAGTWFGRYDEGIGKGLPGALLTISVVDGAPRVSLAMHRHVRNADGSLTSHVVGLPILEQRFENGALRFRTRDDHFLYRGEVRRSVDIEWRFDLTSDDEGELRVLSNSYFAPAAERGESVPPPPPPMKMSREE